MTQQRLFFLLYSLSMLTDSMLQVPYITHGNTVVADTTFIIKYLTATYAKDLTQSHVQLPDPEQHALATACMAVIEEKLLYDLAYHRFVAESVRTLHIITFISAQCLVIITLLSHLISAGWKDLVAYGS